MKLLQFTPDGDLLATVFSRRSDPNSLTATECGMKFFDSLSGKPAYEWSRDIKDGICPEHPFTFADGDSSRVLSNDFFHAALSEWDARNGTLLHHFQVQDASAHGPAPTLKSFSVSRDGRLVVICRERSEMPWISQSRLEIWGLASEKQVYLIPLADYRNPVVRARFSPNGDYVVFVRSSSATVYEYKLP